MAGKSFKISVLINSSKTIHFNYSNDANFN